MAISFHQRNGSGVKTGVTSVSLALTQAIALGEAVIIPLGFAQGTIPTITSITDDSATPNTWSLIISPFKTAGGNQIAAMLFCPMDKTALTTLNHVTFTLSVSSNLYYTIDTFNGFVGTPTVDKTATGSGTGTAADTSSVTTAQANELLYGHAGSDHSTSAFTVGTGYTFVGAAQGYDSNNVGRAEYKIVSATGSYDAPLSISASTDWTAMLATVYDQAATVIDLTGQTGSATADSGTNAPVIACTDGVATATAAGGTNAPVEVYSQDNGRGPLATAAGGTNSLAKAVQAPSGAATADGSAPAVGAGPISATSGAATAAGSTNTPFIVAKPSTAAATAAGGTNTTDAHDTATTGAATAAGGTNAVVLVAKPATASATAAGSATPLEVVSASTAAATADRGTNTVTLVSVALTISPSTGTATASGSATPLVVASASSGAATAVGSASTLSEVTRPSTGVATASASAPAVGAGPIGVPAGAATADGGSNKRIAVVAVPTGAATASGGANILAELDRVPAGAATASGTASVFLVARPVAAQATADGAVTVFEVVRPSVGVATAGGGNNGFQLPYIIAVPAGAAVAAAAAPDLAIVYRENNAGGSGTGRARAITFGGGGLRIY